MSHWFWNRIAARYERSPVPDEESYRRKLAMTQAHMTPQTDAFEFGCGTGTTAIAHAPHVARYHAVDAAENMNEIARGKAETAGTQNLTFDVADFERMDLPAESRDMVLALSILHLLRDRRAAIAKVHRILRPGGLFVSSTACLGDMSPWLKPLPALFRLSGFMPHVRGFTGDALREDIQGAGFSIEEDWRPRRNAALFLIARKT